MRKDGGGPVVWKARTVDLNPPDFFLWGLLKEKVYAASMYNTENLLPIKSLK